MFIIVPPGLDDFYRIVSQKGAILKNNQRQSEHKQLILLRLLTTVQTVMILDPDRTTSMDFYELPYIAWNIVNIQTVLMKNWMVSCHKMAWAIIAYSMYLSISNFKD